MSIGIGKRMRMSLSSSVVLVLVVVVGSGCASGGSWCRGCCMSACCLLLGFGSTM